MTDSINRYFQGVQNKKIAVIGIGVSNTPLIKMLAQSGANVTARDKKSIKEFDSEVLEALRALGVELILGEQYMEGLSQYDIVFKTPGIRFDHPKLLEASRAGTEITSEMEVFFELCPAKIFAVTGSDGKTTTTTLIYEMLKAAGYCCHLGGNIGAPLLPRIKDISSDDMVVVELSSFQLHTMRKSPQVAVVTNVSPNHLDVHTSMEEYVQAKKNVFLHQKAGDTLVINEDNAHTQAFAKEAAGNVLRFSRKKFLKNGAFVKNESIFMAKDGLEEMVVACKEIKIPGVHNVENYMAAACAVFGMVDMCVVAKVAREFGGVPHRIELVCEIGGVRYYNDSIASSPTRTIAGLRAFSQKLLVIAGGYDKHIPFDMLGEELCRCAKTVFLIGKTAQAIKDAVENAPAYKEEAPRLVLCQSLEEAVKAAHERAKEGDVVTLSPACASFDMFTNFEERGNHFKELVKGLE